MKNVSALAALACMLAAAPAQARRTTVSAIGQAQIGPHRTPLVRAQAINQALRRALEKAAELIGGPSEGEDPAADKLVYDRLAAFVPRTAVIAERVEDRVLTVELSVDVDLDALEAAFGGRRGVAAAWMNVRNDERAPQRVAISATPAALEAVVASAFVDAGYRIAGADAELIVVVRGSARPGARDGELWAGEARVEAQLVRARDRRPVATIAQSATQLHADRDAAQKNALVEAARLAAAELTRKVDR
ncbi:MAG TPA: hypothetical protein VFF06_05655 [Polyangia bacterium]|nr:hypothetical protein [Polyangia bacterium]